MQLVSQFCCKTNCTKNCPCNIKLTHNVQESSTKVKKNSEEMIIRTQRKNYREILYCIMVCVYGGLPSFVHRVDTSMNFTSMYFQNRLILEGLENVLSTASVGVHKEKISLHRAMALTYMSNFSKCACSESKLIYI